jgi:hypothetical protein
VVGFTPDKSLAMADVVVPANETVEVDDFDDSDSTYFEDSGSSTQSVTSSIYDYERSHGRTYHAYHGGKYWLPNDDSEQDRMDIMYHAVRLTIGDAIFHAPLVNPTMVLDVGTGTGIWAMDIGLLIIFATLE